jgi:hypothetical protein
MELTPQNILQFAIEGAYAYYVEIAKAEIEDGYGDAMASMERTEATGYLNGLQTAYRIFFGEQHDFPQDFDPTTYEDSL